MHRGLRTGLALSRVRRVGHPQSATETNVHVRCQRPTPIATGAERQKRTFTFVPALGGARRERDPSVAENQGRDLQQA